MSFNQSTNKLLFVGLGGYVIALHMDTGKQVWEATLHGTGIGNPTLVIPDPLESTLLVTSGANLRCLSASSGALIWENKLIGIGIGYPVMAQGRDTVTYNQNTTTRDPYPKAPSYANSKIDPEDIVYVAGNFIVRALSIKTGEELWSHSTPMMEGYSTKPFLLIENGTLFVAGNGRVYALNALAGFEVWRSDVKHRHICTLSTMASGNATENIPFNRHHVSSSSKPSLTDAIYFGASGYINVLSKQTGDEFPIPRNGEITLSGVGYNSSDMIPLAYSDLVLAASAINLRLYDLKSGGLVWENKLKGMGMGVLSVLVGSGVSLNSDIAGESEQLPGYSLVAGGSESYSGNSYSANAQLSFDSLARVLYVSLRGQVRAIRMKDGEQLWNYSPPFMQRSFDANIFFEDDRVFVAGNGVVACLDGRTGKELWGHKKIRRGYTFISTVRSGNGETNRSCLYGNIFKRRQEEDSSN